jgi:teichuronic acid biosynthesis glycosyltransferase TuaH
MELGIPNAFAVGQMSRYLVNTTLANASQQIMTQNENPTWQGLRPGARAALDTWPKTEAGDVVFTFSFDSWATAVRRRIFPSDVVAMDLLTTSRARRVLIADAYSSLFGRVKRCLLRERRAPFPHDDRVSLVSPLRLKNCDPFDARAIKEIYKRYVSFLASTAKERGLYNPVLITTHPFAAAAASNNGFWRHVTYYGWDDWAAHPTYSAYKPAILEAYRTIAAAGHRVIGVTPRIVEGISSQGLSTVVANGIFPLEWAEPMPAPSWFTDLPKPRFIYTGCIDSRLDLEYIKAVSTAFPAATIVIVGYLEDALAVAPLRKITNIYFAPQQSREAIRGITFAADVALIPHIRSDLTQAMSPLKMYEYLAAGKPVVATDLEPIRAIPEVRRAATPEEFVQQIRAALEAEATSEKDRMAFVEANSWSARLRKFYDAAL